ncbi:hypothetical protein [Oceanobacillus oncorhynchi]|nr:hypothetical protein [Oceanobacillus oncorhynchi]
MNHIHLCLQIVMRSSQLTTFVHKVEKRLWAVTDDKATYQAGLNELKEKVKLQEEINSLFNNNVSSGISTDELEIKSSERIDTPNVEGKGNFYDTMRTAVNYYNNSFDVFENVQQEIEETKKELISLNAVDNLEVSIDSITDSTLSDLAYTDAKELLDIRNKFTDYFNTHNGYHLIQSDYSTPDVNDESDYPSRINFNYPGSWKEGYVWYADGIHFDKTFDNVIFDSNYNSYYIIGTEWYDTVAEELGIYGIRISFIDNNTIAIRDKPALFDPDEIEYEKLAEGETASQFNALQQIDFENTNQVINSPEQAKNQIEKYSEYIFDEDLKIEFGEATEYGYRFNIIGEPSWRTLNPENGYNSLRYIFVSNDGDIVAN